VSGVEDAVTRLAREESGHVLALLAARFGDLDLADESVQDALERALRTWPRDGIPDDPPAWLYRVAERRAIDLVRRAASAGRRLAAAAPELTRDPEPAEEVPIVEHTPVGDEQLRLLLLCCHPALDRDAQVALTLRLVGGLTTEEIGAAFLVPEATLAQRIVRAKRKIRGARIPLTIPADLGERVDVLLTVLYLIFNEGYLSRGSAETLRVDLADEAIRLTATAADLLGGHAEAGGLLALELYHRARMATRVDAEGELVLLEHQDRTRWDLATIARADRVLTTALDGSSAGVDDPGPGPYRLQALIAAEHAHAPTAADTDWPRIARLYDALLRRMPTPVVALNRAVAIAMADGPRAGLAELDRVPDLERYHLRHTTEGELRLRAGEPEAALAAFQRALPLVANPAERRHVERRMTEARTRIASTGSGRPGTAH
jgi:RNA polymerase sigma-70 factor, ECF subfamily